MRFIVLSSNMNNSKLECFTRECETFVQAMEEYTKLCRGSYSVMVIDAAEGVVICQYTAEGSVALNKRYRADD